MAQSHSRQRPQSLQPPQADAPRGRWIALLIAVLIVLVAMADGFRTALSATGSSMNAIVTQRGSRSELSSSITRDGAQVLADDPRVMKDANGRAA